MWTSTPIAIILCEYKKRFFFSAQLFKLAFDPSV